VYLHYVLDLWFELKVRKLVGSIERLEDAGCRSACEQADPAGGPLPVALTA